MSQDKDTSFTLKTIFEEYLGVFLGTSLVYDKQHINFLKVNSKYLKLFQQKGVVSRTLHHSIVRWAHLFVSRQFGKGLGNVQI